MNVAYDSDLKKTIEIIQQALARDPKVLKNPAPSVGVAELGDSSIKFFVRPFTKPRLYWDVHMEALKNVREALHNEGISIPFPQREVLIKNQQ